MYGSKIINLLNSFSTKELKSFSEFVASPYFNKNPDLIKLMDLILKVYPDFTSEKLSKSAVFTALFPGEVYDDKKLRYLMSDLLKLGGEFLTIQKVKNQETNGALLLMDEFIDRNLDKHFVQLKNKIKKNKAKDHQTGVDAYMQQMKLSDLEQKIFSRQHQRRFDDNIQHGSDYLNRYFVIKKLKYACGMLDRQAILKGDYDPGLPPGWQQWLESNEFWGETIIKMYSMVYLALKYENDPGYFNQLTQLLHGDISRVPQSDLKELYLYAINYGVRKLRRGEVEYIETILNLYIDGIKKKVLLENGYLSPWTFGNVVKLALRLEKFEWIEQFIENNKHRLPPDFQENAMQYNLAELYCYKKEFSKALTFLFKVSFSDVSYHLGSRIMLSKIYYELNEREALLSLMSSFVVYLKRNKKISDGIRKTCLNFCDLLFLILRGKLNNIEEKIMGTTPVSDKEWLLEKARILLEDGPQSKI